MANEKKVFVSLKPTDSKKGGSKKFESSIANKLLNLPNSKWKLDDKGYKYNGKEITKA